MKRVEKLLNLLSISLLALPLLVSATPLTYDFLGAAVISTIPQTTSASPQAKWDPYRFAEGDAQFPDLTMSDEQQKQLFDLMKNQASDRHQIKQAARQAFIRLQRLAIAEHYDHAEARELAHTYGRALAELTLLNIQLASQVHDLLTPVQRQALQNIFENARQGVESKL